MQGFDDLDDQERDFIQTWNAAVQEQRRTRRVILDRDVALICRQVLQRRNGDIPIKAWTAHLLELWECRQLGRDDMLILMQEFHEQRRARAALMGNTDDEDA